MSSSEDEPELETLDISNDQYYQPCRIDVPKKIIISDYKQRVDKAFHIPIYGSSTIRHSLPAYDLWQPLYPSYLNDDKFRNLNRPKLRHFNRGPQALSTLAMHKPFPIKSLTQNIKRFQEDLRNKVIQAIQSEKDREYITSKFLLIRHAKNLTAKQGELFLFEYSEEYPPVLCRVGMASNIKTYIFQEENHVNKKFKSGDINSSNASQVNLSNCTNPEYQFRSLSNNIGYTEHVTVQKTQKHLYFNQMKPGDTFNVIENNLYRAPIFEHRPKSTDFLVIRTRNSFYIRSIENMFTVGQTMPLVPVPVPSDKEIAKFRLDLSNVYIHKLFKESIFDPPAIKFDDIVKYFPDYDKAVLKKRMQANGTQISNKFHTRGTSNYGVLSLVDLRRLVTPERYCLGMASLAAIQRLRELNYSDSMIDSTKNDAELEVEVLAAPWHTSLAVANTMAGKCYLDLKHHLIDPSGFQREGFSCVAWSRSPTEDEQNKVLRDNAAKQTAPQASVKFQDRNPNFDKIRREKQERLSVYLDEAQRIAETQAKVLSSTEILSSGEDDADEGSLDENASAEKFDEQLRDLNKLLAGKSVADLNHEIEEEERRKFLSDLKINPTRHKIKPSAIADVSRQTDSNKLTLSGLKNKIMVITRTYNTSEGKIQRTEIVREPRIIAHYVSKKGHNPIVSPHKSIREKNSAKTQSCVKTNSAPREDLRKRSNSTSLGPSELCRADGTRLTISKKVLEKVRPMRRCRRESNIG